MLGLGAEGKELEKTEPREDSETKLPLELEEEE
jgi:hypothetical protein